MTITNNVILITGGSLGIGLALATQLQALGNRVIICGRNADVLDAAARAVPGLVTVQCDVADAASRAAMVAWLEAEHPDLTMLINNAGVQYPRGFLGDDALKELDAEIAINLTAPIALTGELLPLLLRQPAATIINVTSGLAFATLAGLPVYCATKAALHSFTLSLRYQLRDTAVRVVEMMPPMVDTGLGSRPADGRPKPPMMTADACASEALALLGEGKLELLIGTAANFRAQGEALFDRMNGR